MDEETIGCLVIAGAVIFGGHFLLSNYPVQTVLGGVTLTLTVVAVKMHNNEVKRRKEEQEEAKKQYNDKCLSRDFSIRQLQDYRETFEKSSRLIPIVLSDAFKSFEQAKIDFEESVLFPFWESIWNTQQSLVRYGLAVNELKHAKREHDRIMPHAVLISNTCNTLAREIGVSDVKNLSDPQTYKLTFPKLLYPRELVDQLNDLVRSAHKDPNLANAYGHFLTHKNLKDLSVRMREIDRHVVSAINSLEGEVNRVSENNQNYYFNSSEILANMLKEGQSTSSEVSKIRTCLEDDDDDDDY